MLDLPFGFGTHSGSSHRVLSISGDMLHEEESMASPDRFYTFVQAGLGSPADLGYAYPTGDPE